MLMYVARHSAAAMMPACIWRRIPYTMHLLCCQSLAVGLISVIPLYRTIPFYPRLRISQLPHANETTLYSHFCPLSCPQRTLLGTSQQLEQLFQPPAAPVNNKLQTLFDTLQFPSVNLPEILSPPSERCVTVLGFVYLFSTRARVRVHPFSWAPPGGLALRPP